MATAPATDRRRRYYQLGALLVTAALLAGVALAVLRSGSTFELAPGKPVPHSRAALALFAGIPQHGVSLGNPRAPVTLVELGDPQCPSCALFAQETLPKIVSRYVRPGRVQLVFRSLTSIGGDSLRAARFAGALGEQNHLWEFLELMYRNQGAEQSGYVTDKYLRALASAIPGVDVERALAQRHTPAVQAEIDRAAAIARQFHVKGTPSFLLSRSGAASQRLAAANPSLESFTGPLDRELARGGA